MEVVKKEQVHVHQFTGERDCQEETPQEKEGKVREVTQGRVEIQEKVHEGDCHEEVREGVGKGGQGSVHHNHRQQIEGQEACPEMKMEGLEERGKGLKKMLKSGR